MADVNWGKYDCSICLAVTLTAAAAASALVVSILGSIGIGIVFQVILFLIVWAVLGWLADGFCAARSSNPAAAATASAETTVTGAEASVSADAAVDADRAGIAADATAQAAEEAAARKAAEDAQAAAEAKAAAKAEAKAKEEAEARAAAEAEAKAANEAAARKAAEEAEAEEAARKDANAMAAAAAEAGADDDLDRDGDGIIEGTGEGTRPEALDGPRNGAADDLKRIKGIGPKLEQLCNRLGFYHFDQIAGWSSDEVAWVDSNLEGFKGRVSRDEWVSQAKQLAEGGETEFSKRVDGGNVPSSQ